MHVYKCCTGCAVLTHFVHYILRGVVIGTRYLTYAAWQAERKAVTADLP